MALDTKKITPEVLLDIRERVSEESLSEMTAKEAFVEYCEWHGLIGWGNPLIRVYEQLQAAEIK